ncbi:MAG: hypothetical protein ACOZF2_06545 [Thermodesulfobacteriota bacterium]
MKWFEHQTDCELNKKFQKLEMHYHAQAGDGFFAAYGRVWRLYEVIGRLGEDRTSKETFDLPPDFTLDLLAYRLRCPMDYLLEFLSALAEVGLIDKSTWENEQRVYVPKLQERADTYTKRKNRNKTVSEECSNHGRTPSKEGQTKFSPHSHSHSQAKQASACVADPATPTSDAATLPEPAKPASDRGGGSEKVLEQTNAKFGPASLVKLWNDLGCRPMVSELTDDRRKKAGLRLRKRGDPDWWGRLFEKVQALNKPWLTFDFLMRSDTNCLKVLEGNYDHDFRAGGNGGKDKLRFGAHKSPNRADPGKYASIGRTFATDPGTGGAGPTANPSGQGGVPDPSESSP